MSRRPFFIVFEDAPLLLHRRNSNILALLNVHERLFSFPLFVILTEKISAKPASNHMNPAGNNVMVMSGIPMFVNSLRRSNDHRSRTEQHFEAVMEKSYTLPYPDMGITLQNDIMVIDVPVPVDSKYKYSYERRVEEDEKITMRAKHLKELDFFLRAHHLYCPDLQRCRYLDIKRIRNWLQIIRMAYSLQSAKGMTYLRESEIYDVYNKTKDTVERTGKPIYVSENASDTLYGVIDRKMLEQAVKVEYNIIKEGQPDSTQEVCQWW